MQDILSEANLSSGALYRYFRSKEEIIIAIAQDVLAGIASTIENALEPDVPLHPHEVLGRMFTALEAADNEQNMTRMAVQVWSEAVRSTAIAEQVSGALGQTLEVLVSRIKTYQASGTMTNSVPPELIARAIFSVMPGFMLQRAIFGDVDAEMFQRAFTALIAGERHE
jgi:TetR/AcrR family transcriptional regulator, transcriptional repressor of aconitase